MIAWACYCIALHGYPWFFCHLAAGGSGLQLESTVNKAHAYSGLPHSEKSPARAMLFYSTNYWYKF